MRYIQKRHTTTKNTQVHNTPVVIFSLGKPRYLSWRKRYLKVNSKQNNVWSYGSKSEFSTMLLNEGDICVINPWDEVPKICPLNSLVSNYQHGNVSYTDDGFSIGFVFRVTNKIDQFYTSTNLRLCNKDVEEKYKNLYKDYYSSVDLAEFHKKIIDILGKTIT